MSKVLQRDLFIGGEGDAWFARNRERLLAFDQRRDMPMRLLTQFEIEPKRVLEIGCSNGGRLAALGELWGCETVGTDVSQAAVEDGRQRFGLDLRHQPASKKVDADVFDLVLVNFVLHWVARELLDAVLDAIDASLGSNGVLLVGDFSPDHDIDVPYHHLPEGKAWTYKRDYSRLLMNRLGLRLVGCLTGAHGRELGGSHVCSEERVGYWLLERSAAHVTEAQA